MDAFWMSIEELPFSLAVGESYWFPLFESIHVVAATFLVGTIVMLDLRLVGWASLSQRVSRISAEVVPWTLGAAVLAVVAGVPLFMTRAAHYAHNTAFQIKIVFLVLAGVNMLWFHFRTSRSMSVWDAAVKPASAARFAGACSIVVWIAVMLSGRWIGHLL